ncbi:transcription factor S [Halocalculus aciditolerans]|uniref:Transcription factor S n=1 Tax=Halocalculus aciditolerans TaxID=1383812 RepID=A0A830FMW0_9EURY|nr:transcription factor S [Halocalculus aciditolerans]GGL62479.1 transcription factor S [Halocalculus aciditolerans]
MEFCDECGSMMQGRDGTWVCTNEDCGFEKPKGDTAEFVSAGKQEDSGVIDVSDAEDQGMPKTTVKCPECGNMEAYYYMQQIRSADESETRFFICTECEHKWREDDH